LNRVSAPVTWTVDFDRETELILVSSRYPSPRFRREGKCRRRAATEVARRSGRQVPNRCEYANDPGQNDDAF